MSVAKNVVANYIGAAVTALMTIAFVPLYIRFLGIEAYGLIALFAMLQGWLILLDLGMAPAINREMAFSIEDARKWPLLRDLLRSMEVIALLLASLLAIAAWLGSRWLATHWFGASTLSPAAIRQAIAIMGGVIGLRLLENVYRSTLIGMQRQVALNAALAMLATLRGVGAIVVLEFSATTAAYFAWQALVSIVGTALFAALVYARLPGEPRARFSLSALRTVSGFAAGAMTIACLSLLLTSIDKLLLSRLLPMAAFGYYAFALTVAQAPLGLVAPVAQAFFPQFSALAAKGDEGALRAAYHVAAQIVSVLLGTATAILVLLGDRVLDLWMDDRVVAAQSRALISVLAAGSLLNGVMTIPYYLQLAAGWTALTIRANAIALAVIVPALLILVPRYGALAAAWVWFALNAAFVVFVVPLMHRRLLRAEKWRWYGHDVGLPLAAAAATCAALRVLVAPAGGTAWRLCEILLISTLALVAAATAAPAVRAYLVARRAR